MTCTNSVAELDHDSMQPAYQILLYTHPLLWNGEPYDQRRFEDDFSGSDLDAAVIVDKLGNRAFSSDYKVLPVEPQVALAYDRSSMRFNFYNGLNRHPLLFNNQWFQADQFDDVELENNVIKCVDIHLNKSGRSACCTDNNKSDQGDVTFTPPLYIQRYMAAAKVISTTFPQDCTSSQRGLRVIDFGAAECKLLRRSLRNLEDVVEYIAVDIRAADLQSEASTNLRADHTDYLAKRRRPLRCSLVCGSVCQPQPEWIPLDVALLLELVEHLPSDELSTLPHALFGQLQPSVVFVTTPNVEYNVMFSTNGFRHWDHKFEWTRAEFETWCSGICDSYPDYTVTFSGVGEPPAGREEELGYCTQSATFVRQSLQDHVRFSEQIDSDIVTRQLTNVIYHCDYPFEPIPSRSDSLRCDIPYAIRQLFVMTKYLPSKCAPASAPNDDGSISEDDEKEERIELKELLQSFCLTKLAPTREEVLQVLKEEGYVVEDEVNAEGVRKEWIYKASDDMCVEDVNKFSNENNCDSDYFEERESQETKDKRAEDEDLW